MLKNSAFYLEKQKCFIPKKVFGDHQEAGNVQVLIFCLSYFITSLKGPKHSQQQKPGFWFRPDTETETRNGQNLKKMAKEILAPMLTLDLGIDSRYLNPVSVVDWDYEYDAIHGSPILKWRPLMRPMPNGKTYNSNGRSKLNAEQKGRTIGSL